MLGSELLDKSVRIRAELLKGAGNKATLRDYLFTSSVSSSLASYNKAPVAANLTSTFLFYKVEETTKRIITASKSVVLPDSPLVKAHITGCDVIHSWTIPAIGVRIDAVPGKVYSVKIPFKHYGIFVGQCSEVCGLRHAYMPISVAFLPSAVFTKQIYILLFSSLDFYFSRYLQKPLF